MASRMKLINMVITVMMRVIMKSLQMTMSTNQPKPRKERRRHTLRSNNRRALLL